MWFGNERRREMELMELLLVASNKNHIPRWLAQTPPTLDDWFGTILEIIRMEKVTSPRRIQQDKFGQFWYCIFFNVLIQSL